MDGWIHCLAESLLSQLVLCVKRVDFMEGSFIMEIQWAVMQEIAQKAPNPVPGSILGHYECTGYWLGPLCLGLVSCSRPELKKTPTRAVSKGLFSEQCPNPESPRSHDSEVKNAHNALGQEFILSL